MPLWAKGIALRQIVRQESHQHFVGDESSARRQADVAIDVGEDAEWREVRELGAIDRFEIATVALAEGGVRDTDRRRINRAL